MLPVNPVKITGHLQNRLHQSFLGTSYVGDIVIHQCLGQLFHLARDLGRSRELDHLQSAMDLMDRGQAGAQAAEILRRFRNHLECLLCLLQRLADLALDPIQSYIVLGCAHIDATLLYSGSLKPVTDARS